MKKFTFTLQTLYGLKQSLERQERNELGRLTARLNELEAGETALLAHVLLEHAEAARELDLLLGRELLVAEERDFVVEERVGDLRERVVVERLREIDARDFGAAVFSDAGDGDHAKYPGKGRTDGNLSGQVANHRRDGSPRQLVRTRSAAGAVRGPAAAGALDRSR